MDRYIQQLIEDLETASSNPPGVPYFETPPGLEVDPIMAELAMAPFSSLEKLTGIKQEAFPDLNDLHGRHWKYVLEALFEVFEALHIKLIDIPAGIPKEWLYHAITSSWQQPVQYLPSSGTDLELCTGDPETCPYGGFCNCEHDWEEDEEEPIENMIIPDQYEAFVPQIAEAIEAGYVCFLNLDTLKLTKVLLKDYDYHDESGILSGIDEKGENCEISIFENYFRAEPLLRFEWDDIMESFISTLSDEPFKGRLFKALQTKNRLERFSDIILRSAEQQHWLSYKKTWLEQLVRRLFWLDLNDPFEFPGEFNGLFNDDGSPIDPDQVPTPDLCMLCKSYYRGDQEEDMLCILNRNDQRNEPDFTCGAFEKL